MQIDYNKALDFSDVLIQPKRSSLSSRSEVSLYRKIKFRNGEVFNGIPIIAANMDQVATLDMAKALSKYDISTALHKHYTTEEYRQFFDERTDSYVPIFFTMGISEDEINRLKKLRNSSDTFTNYICVDNANGYTEKFSNTIAKLRDLFPDVVIMAGNVVGPGMTEQLILSGADIVKVGIGPGSVCTTRKMTGVGLPQLTATIECADAAHGLGGFICSDGGMTCPGDVVKAFGGGADFAMMGGMFAGHIESGLPVKTLSDGTQYMEFYGMSSRDAMEKHSNGVAKYRAAEGKAVKIPVRGSLEDTVGSILGGIRSACTYVGAKELKYLPKCTTFRVVNNQLNTVFGNS